MYNLLNRLNLEETKMKTMNLTYQVVGFWILTEEGLPLLLLLPHEVLDVHVEAGRSRAL